MPGLPPLMRRFLPFTPLAVAGLAALTMGALILPCPAAAAVGGRPTKRDGDLLKIFERQIVYVVTNDDPAVADALLEGCSQKERRVLTIEEWRKKPADLRQFVSPVFLINRERLPVGAQFPNSCLADGDEVWTEVKRSGRPSGFTYEVTLSAPDSTWLRRAIESFRSLRESPRQPVRRNVRSIVVVPVGSGAQEAAELFIQRQNSEDDFNKRSAAHLLPAALVQPSAKTPARCDLMEELVLVDRSSALGEVPALPTGTTLASPGDTVAWRETKPDGRARVIYSAPSAGALFEAVRRPGKTLSPPETLTVMASARDLRTVRRVAVAGVKNGVGGEDLAKRIASEAAVRLRALDTFEVLERSGLNEILGEVALNQAGITHATDRTRVRQLAAADTLLIVEVTGVGGKTEYGAKAQRLTPRLAPPPRRPAEPTRLRYDILIPGAENNPLIRSVTESVLGRAVGTKSRREYRSAINDYNETTLRRWQEDVDNYYAQREKRQIDWKQDIIARGAATVKGSLRLVDLTDGLVLWEAPFSATEQGESAWATRRAVTYGEDSNAPSLPEDCPDPKDVVADELIDRAIDSALTQGIQALRGTALLPSTSAVLGTASASEFPVNGRVLDVDGDSLLIGLGAGDGVKLGDTLHITLADGQIVRVVTTRVRPRTCDAAFAPAVPLALKSRAAIGQAVLRETVK
ncbi:MAG: CsgG/HfaB family protein [Armatimonadota bacterium]